MIKQLWTAEAVVFGVIVHADQHVLIKRGLRGKAFAMLLPRRVVEF